MKLSGNSKMEAVMGKVKSKKIKTRRNAKNLPRSRKRRNGRKKQTFRKVYVNYNESNCKDFKMLKREKEFMKRLMET